MTQAIALELPLSDMLSPEVPTQSTMPSGSATAQPVWTLELQKVFDELRAQRYTLQSIEGYVHEKLMEVQAMQDLQAARIRELQENWRIKIASQLPLQVHRMSLHP